MKRFFPMVLFLLLVAAFLMAVAVGSHPIPLKAVTSILLHPGAGEWPHSWVQILWKLRLPRALAAMMVGGVLAVGGGTCQGLFRNPLAEPYLLGISSGASLGAALAIVFLPFGAFAGLSVIGLAAFLGSLVVTVTVFSAAGRGAFRLPATLLLAGIAVAFLCQSGVWLIMALNRDQVERITFWTLGSLSSVGWSGVMWLALITAPVVLAQMALGRVLDVMSTGHDGAHGLGLDPSRMALILLTLTALGTAAAVSVAGTIGFIGLMVPHFLRWVIGPAHQRLLLSSWLGGGILLLLADAIARTVTAPGEIPVGVVTALMGAPFLLVMARGKQQSGRLDG
ncbi:MAG: iron ABC transporter permease [Spirochaetales bacterium]|nr:iron ABC transporter permease [Spirochaetales bacterium]